MLTFNVIYGFTNCMVLINLNDTNVPNLEKMYKLES